MTAGRESVSLQKSWCTPEPLVTKIHNFFNNKLDLDPCSNPYSLIKANKKSVKKSNNSFWDFLSDANSIKNVLF